MKHLVLGLGEVGNAVRSVLEADGYDPYNGGGALRGPYDMVHICFPWSEDKFVSEVKRYIGGGIAKEGTIVVVHSTVPVGICDQYGWTHSPIRGVHPNLEEGIRTFVKFIGGKNFKEVAEVFAEKGIKTFTCDFAKETEAMKLWDTTQYGLMIAIQKQIAAYCDRHDVDFNVVYTEANKTYNMGYEELNKPEVIRPVLKHMQGPVGGHCIIPNAKLLYREGLSLVKELLDMQQILESAQEK